MSLEKNSNTKLRNSSIELFRIIIMLIIVAHHYVFTSGLMNIIEQNGLMKVNSIFLLLFGWGGKTGINCFVLITGYFMCQSNITLKKFLKLFLEIEFYNIVIYFVFLLSGYSNFSLKEFIKTILPIYGIGTTFPASYLVFFLFIPFLNILIDNMNKKQHFTLICLCVLIYTIFTTFLMFEIKLNYTIWFIIIYFIGAYIKLYPCKWFDNKNLAGISTIVSLIFSWFSIIICAWICEKMNINDWHYWYYFVMDSNKILALITALSAFCFFKNLNIGYSKFINDIATSAFGVLLIHYANSDICKWLWKDTLNNIGQYTSDYLVLHAFGSVIGVYIICTLIDLLRIKFLEKPFFKWYDKKLVNKKESL